MEKRQEKKTDNTQQNGSGVGAQFQPSHGTEKEVKPSKKKRSAKPGELGKQKEDPEDGNIGKNNAGGFE